MLASLEHAYQALSEDELTDSIIAAYASLHEMLSQKIQAAESSLNGSSDSITENSTVETEMPSEPEQPDAPEQNSDLSRAECDASVTEETG